MLLSGLSGSSPGSLMSADDHGFQNTESPETDMKEPRMTTTRLAVAGALVLNIPTIVAAAFLSAGAVVITAVVLAVVGAALGTVTGWAIAPTAEETTVAAAPAHERLAA